MNGKDTENYLQVILMDDFFPVKFVYIKTLIQKLERHY